MYIPEEFTNKSKLDKDAVNVFFRMDPVYNRSKRARLACSATENILSHGIVATAMKSRHRKLKLRSVFNQVMFHFQNPSKVNEACVAAAPADDNDCDSASASVTPQEFVAGNTVTPSGNSANSNEVVFKTELA